VTSAMQSVLKAREKIHDGRMALLHLDTVSRGLTEQISAALCGEYSAWARRTAGGAEAGGPAGYAAALTQPDSAFDHGVLAERLGQDLAGQLSEFLRGPLTSFTVYSAEAARQLNALKRFVLASHERGKILPQEQALIARLDRVLGLMDALESWSPSGNALPNMTKMLRQLGHLSEAQHVAEGARVRSQGVRALALDSKLAADFSHRALCSAALLLEMIDFAQFEPMLREYLKLCEKRAASGDVAPRYRVAAPKSQRRPAQFQGTPAAQAKKSGGVQVVAFTPSLADETNRLPSAPADEPEYTALYLADEFGLAPDTAAALSGKVTSAELERREAELSSAAGRGGVSAASLVKQDPALLTIPGEELRAYCAALVDVFERIQRAHLDRLPYYQGVYTDPARVARTALDQLKAEVAASIAKEAEPAKATAAKPGKKK
jgi:hypothetical protein